MSLNNPFAIGQGSNEVMHPLHPYLRYPDLWRGCVGAWAPCLGAGVLKLQDNSGRGNHGTLTNMDAATDWIPSQGKMALDFDGSDDYVVKTGIADPLKLKEPTGQKWTASAWVYVKSIPASSYFACGTWPTTVGTGWRLSVRNVSSTVRVQVGVFSPGAANGLSGYSTASVELNKWTHIAGVYNGVTSGTKAILYINGIDAGYVEIGNQSPGTLTSTAFAIGATANGASLFFDGLIDDVRVYLGDIGANDVATLALRRGIAYELAPRRRYKAAEAGGGFKAAWALQRSAIIGGGMR